MLKANFIKILSLAAVCLLSLFSPNESGIAFGNLILLLLVSISSEYVLTKLFLKETVFRWQNISFAFLVFLICDPGNIIFSLFAVIFCHISYYLLNIDGKPFFNPVTLAIFLFGFFGLKVSWWGTSAGAIALIIIIISGIIISLTNNLLKSTASYLLVIFSITFTLSLNPLYSIKQIFVPGFLFFTFFVLQESMFKLKYDPKLLTIYIISVSALAIIIPKFGVFTDPLITSIVLADFVFFIPQAILLLKARV